jgi:hypothetical protein
VQIPYDSDLYIDIIYDSLEAATEETEGYELYADAMEVYYGIKKQSLRDRNNRLADEAVANAQLCRVIGLDASPVIWLSGDASERHDPYVMIFDCGKSDFFLMLETAKVSSRRVGEFVYRVSTDRAPSVLDQIAWSLRDSA